MTDPTPTRADVLREPNALTALAEACERAADTHDGISEVMAGRQPEASYHKYGDADVLRSLARAIREGRVTINEEESPDA